MLRLALPVTAVSLALCAAVLLATAPAAGAEQAASALRVREAGALDAGATHACAVLSGGVLRCWGLNGNGQLGDGDNATIGDNELPSTVAPVSPGAGRTVRAVAAGEDHTCAILDDGSVRCWGRDDVGQLGYGSLFEYHSPRAGVAVDLGPGRTARAIAAGSFHSCAILDDGTVRCWGLGSGGQLGYGNTEHVGDNETPAAVAPVNLPTTARAITAGFRHTCALLDNGSVYCWGVGNEGELGYGNEEVIGNDEDPRDAGPVSLGAGRTAVAVSAGAFHTCAVLDDGTVRCWGEAVDGQLGYASETNIGDNELPSAVGPVNLGPARTARAIAAGNFHTCAILDDDTVRCWGRASSGQLGYANRTPIGDNEAPDTAGPVALGAGRSARAITAGGDSTCAVLDEGSVLCWGDGTAGQLGIGSVRNVGDDETPASVGPAGLGGAVATAIGDAALTLTSDAPTRRVGESARLTVTLSSAGPNAVSGAAVTVALAPGLQLASATPSAGSFAGATWSVPALAPGTTATLVVVARVVSAGTHTASAELTAAAPFFEDVDSTPANHVASEDDQAAVAITADTAITSAAGSAPVLSGLSMLRRTFGLAAGRTATAAAATSRGTAFRFTLSKRATVTMLIERTRTGRRAGRRCVAPTHANAHRARCTRLTRMGTLTRRNLAAGRHSVAFSGRIGRHALAAGSYRATLTPTDAQGLHGTARRIAFAVQRS